MTFTLPLIGRKPNRFQLSFHQAQAGERWLFSGNRAGKTDGCVADECMDLFALHLWRPRFSTRVHEADTSVPVEVFSESKMAAEVVDTLLFRAGDPLYDQREEFAGRAAAGRIVWWDAAPDYPNVWKPNNHGLFVAMFGEMGLTEGDGPNQWRWKESERRFILNIQMECEGEVFEWVGEIWAKSYDAGRSKFQAAGIAGIHFDEEMGEDLYDEGTMRVGKGWDIWMTASMTPVTGMPWIREKIWDPFEIGTLPSWRAVIRGSLFDNLQNLPIASVEKLLEKYPEGSIERKIRIYGEFAMREGLVYPDFSLETHVIDDFWPGDDELGTWTLYRALDIGLRNPTACLFAAVNVEGEVYIWDEHYAGEMQLQDHLPAIMAKSGNLAFRFTVIDPASSQRDKITGTSPLTYLAENGLACIPGNNSVVEGITAVADLIRVDKRVGRARLFICRRCSNTIREMRSYRWSRQTVQQSGRVDPSEKVQKKDDHAMDALRYLAASRPSYRDDGLKVAEDEYAGNRHTGY